MEMVTSRWPDLAHDASAALVRTGLDTCLPTQPDDSRPVTDESLRGARSNRHHPRRSPSMFDRPVATRPDGGDE